MKKFVTASVCALLAASMSFVSAGVAGAATGHNTGRPEVASAGPPATGVSGWAVINDDGSVARSSNGKGASNLNPGEYEVDFNSAITKCAYTATTGLTGTSGDPVAGYATVTGRSGNKKAIFVETFDSTGTLTNLAFHVVVSC